MVLSPVVNIARYIRWGRTEETYGGDPVTSVALKATTTGGSTLTVSFLSITGKKASYNTTLKKIDLKPESTHTITVEYHETTGDARVRLIMDAGVEVRQHELIDKTVGKNQRRLMSCHSFVF